MKPGNIFKKTILTVTLFISATVLYAQKTDMENRKWYLDSDKSGRDFITLMSDGKYQSELKNKTENGEWIYDHNAKTIELKSKKTSKIYRVEKIGFAELILVSPQNEKQRFIIKTEM